MGAPQFNAFLLLFATKSLSCAKKVLLLERLKTAVSRINPDIPAGAREDAIKQIERLHSPELTLNT